MNKKEQARLDKQLDQIADNLLMEAYRETFSIVDGIYARLLVKLRDKINRTLPKKEEWIWKVYGITCERNQYLMKFCLLKRILYAVHIEFACLIIMVFGVIFSGRRITSLNHVKRNIVYAMTLG